MRVGVVFVQSTREMTTHRWRFPAQLAKGCFIQVVKGCCSAINLNYHASKGGAVAGIDACLQVDRLGVGGVGLHMCAYMLSAHRLLHLLQLDSELCRAIAATTIAVQLLHLIYEAFCVACELQVGFCCRCSALTMPCSDE